MGRVGAYELTTEWSTAGGGQSRWAFAKRGDREFFIKEFLSPTYPLPDGPGSAATKARKMDRCTAFEEHHGQLTAALAPLSAAGGNLIVTRDFFRSGAKYYKVTDKVDISSLTVDQISRLEPIRQLVLAGTVVHSLQILHRHQLVHGDIKPPNVLIKETTPGHYAAKLIDFDNAYYERRPVPAEELVGDPSYYSPETLLYIQAKTGEAALTCAADIFSLGILFSEYFAGRKPRFVDRDESPSAVAVLNGRDFTTGLEDGWPAVDALVRDMLALSYVERPSVFQVFDKLNEIRRDERVGRKRRPVEISDGSRLRGTLTKSAKPRLDEGDVDSDVPRLRGSLTRQGDISEESPSDRLKGSLAKKSPPAR